MNLVSDYLPSSIIRNNSLVVDFDVDSHLNVKLKLTNTEKSEELVLKYDLHLRKWIERAPIAAATVSVIDDTERTSRLENLKKMCLSNPSLTNDRQISELELEMSLIMVNFKNSGLKHDELAHFERIVAMYAVKLAKDSKILKARELLKEIESIGMNDLNETLLKPILCQSNLSHSWQDFISASN